jgi:hypothetical protein
MKEDWKEVGIDQATCEEAFDWTELKIQMNNVTLCYGPPDITLKQAEAMLKYIGHLASCHGKK